jgi:integrase
VATLRLTARTVEAARPPAAGRLELFDADLPGFCIRITPNGRRTACVFYRFGPRLRRATLGTLPPLTLADARQLAREALHSAALGEDPASAKRSAREAITLAKLVRDYITAGEGRRSDATNGDYRRTLKGVVEESPLGHQAARQVARGELRAFLEGIARKAPIRANRVLALVRAAFRWGLREELIERDPTAGLQRLRPERPRERVLADEEVKKLWETLDAIAAGSSDPVLESGKKAPRLVIAGAVKLLLLLGTRRSETLNMRWSDIDERAQTWTVPGAFRKGGRTHVVPLPPLALRLLTDLRPISGATPWVFVGKRGASLANNPSRWSEILRKASGLDFTLHDLRRTCATGCARLGASESTVSRILGHKAIAGTIAVSGIYDRFDRLPEIRSALVAWSSYVETLVTGEEKRGEVQVSSPSAVTPRISSGRDRDSRRPAREVSGSGDRSRRTDRCSPSSRLATGSSEAASRDPSG